MFTASLAMSRSSFDHLLPAQGSVKTGPRVTILSRNLAAGSAFAMLVDVWQARSSNPWWRAWDCPGNKVRSQREQSAGSLCPNRCPRDRCTSSGCAGACACASGGIWIADSENVLLFFEPAQTVVPHGPDRNLDVCEVVHEPGGVPAAAASG
jgi:hypothetical protein